MGKKKDAAKKKGAGKRKDAVQQASRRFYGALNQMANGDNGAMADIWSNSARVTAMHPIGGRDMGWDDVRSSFERVADVAADGSIELQDQTVRVFGRTAYETGVEKGTFSFAGEPVSFEVRVTNIYRREGGQWRIVHHHTDVSPEMLDRLSRL